MDIAADSAAPTLRLLSLLQTRLTWPASELADRPGTSARTLPSTCGGLVALDYEGVGKPGPTRRVAHDQARGLASVPSRPDA